MTPQTSSSWGLASPRNHGEDLKGRLLKQGFSQGLLVQSGLVVQRETGETRGPVSGTG